MKKQSILIRMEDILQSKLKHLLKKTTGADKSWWGPEFEFYIFSKVEYDTRTASSFYQV
ncbi:MAG: hypothetical protein MZV64_09090 [Ignavibacteriales bacterium]|nr:hypothetical protein [Ignavibacteriales bacterium]